MGPYYPSLLLGEGLNRDSGSKRSVSWSWLIVKFRWLRAERMT